jgi:hypothetical protein
VGRHPEQRDVLSPYPLGDGAARDPGQKKKEGEDQAKDAQKSRVRVKTLICAPVTFKDILGHYLIAQIAQVPLLPLLSSARFFSILFPFLLENTLDDLALLGVFGPSEVDLS